MNNTIEQIEKNSWPEPPQDSSSLIATCHKLRKKPLKDFSIEDFRILISQNFSLETLMPLVLEILRGNIFAEGDYYEGDLLKSVLTSDKNFWNDHPKMKHDLIQIYTSNNRLFDDWDVTEKIRTSIQNAFDEFTQDVK